MTDEELIWELVDAAYESGYYSGKYEDDQPYHKAAIERREELRAEALRRLTNHVHRGRRRKAKSVLCGTDTWDWDRVCLECRQLYTEGLRHTSVPREPHGIRRHLNLRGEQCEQSGKSMSHPGETLTGLIERIAQSPRLAGTHVAKHPYLGDRTYDVLLLTDDQAEAVKELIALCRYLHRSGYEEGRDVGMSLLVGIASGEITIERYKSEYPRIGGCDNR